MTQRWEERFARPPTDPLNAIPAYGCGRWRDLYTAWLAALIGEERATAYLPDRPSPSPSRAEPTTREEEPIERRAA